MCSRSSCGPRAIFTWKTREATVSSLRVDFSPLRTSADSRRETDAPLQVYKPGVGAQRRKLWPHIKIDEVECAWQDQVSEMAMSLAEIAPCPTAVATLKHAGRQTSPAA